MQLNFAGILVIGLGIVAVGLAISGNYKTFGQSVKASLSRNPANAIDSKAPGTRGTAPSSATDTQITGR